MSTDCCLGKIYGEDSFYEDNGEKNSRSNNSEQARQARCPTGSLDECEEEDDRLHLR